MATSGARLALPRSARPRRSQAERRATTRARILAAVVESIAEVGFQRTTAAEIARRAGVTWGAVQHHFGGKDGILLAVLEDSFRRFSDLIQEPGAGEPLQDRVARFVAAAWEHFGSDHYRSTFEILLHYLPDESEQQGPTLQVQMLRLWDDLFGRLFPEAPVPKRRLLERYALAVLSGLATTQALAGSAAEPPALELSLLTDTLTRELGGPSPGSQA